jgi:hypothetical protein
MSLPLRALLVLLLVIVLLDRKLHPEILMHDLVCLYQLLVNLIETSTNALFFSHPI